MTVAGLQKSTLVDFPGRVACVLFTPGCNYDCYFCHNRQLLDGSAPILDSEELEAFLKKRAGQLDGVVITGGEPTLQPDLAAYLAWLKSLGYQTKLDTNGSKPETVKALLAGQLCDYVAVDYKAPAAQYEAISGIAGATADPVRETIGMLLDSGIEFEIRTTVLPQLGEEALLTMARELPVVPRWTLNRYRMPELYRPEDADKVSAPPPTKDDIAAYTVKMRSIQPNIAS